MSYEVKTTKTFDNKLRKLDRPTQKLILTYILQNLQNTENPYSKGRALSNNLKGLWRYRIADYRLIVEIRDKELIIFALDIGHRRDIYKRI